MKKLITLITGISLISASLFSQPQYFIDTEFPGGNIDIEKITKDTIWLNPDYRDTEGKWFWWNYRIKNAENKSLVFCFHDKDVFTTFGPVVSFDEGKNWSYLKEEQFSGNSFKFSFKASDKNVQFAMALPYTQTNLYDFLNNEDSKLIKKEILCKTRAEREVEKLIIKDENSTIKHKVLITCRHHACESSASFVLEGIMDAVLNDKELQWCRDNVEFMIIPFVDKDGVEKGDQGKNRSPRDHNRDYSETSVYNTTKTIREEIPAWAEDKLIMTLDIHSPWIKGNYNEYIYLVGCEDKNNQEQQKVFSNLIEKNNSGELKYSHDNFLSYGTSWNKANSFSKGMNFETWSNTKLNIPLSTTMEVPYANISGIPLTEKNAKEFGHDLAKAIQEYIQQNK